MISNSVVMNSGAEVYLTEIQRLADEYTAGLDDETAQQPQTFTAMLNYIYRNLFMPTKANMDVYERNRGTARQNSILPYDNIELLNEIWNTYVDLAVNYKQIPTLLDYSVLTGIDKDTLTTWENGTARGKTDAHMRTIKAWKSMCESIVSKRVLQSNSIGGIFILKSCYGYRETTPIDPQLPDNGTRSTPEEIAERWKDAKRPEIPYLE